jgi:rhodanese-related sulfurtransferase
MKKLSSATFVFLVLIVGTIVGLYSCSAQQPKIDVKKAFLVDVRTPDEFAEGTVSGAVNIPLNEVAQRLDEFKGKQQIVVFCRSGNRSTQAATILKQNGFTNVVNGGTRQMVDKIVKEQTNK